MKRQGILSIGIEFLGDLIHLPKGHRIVAVRASDPFRPDYFDVLVEGPTLPESAASDPLPKVSYEVSQKETGKMVPERIISGRFAS